MEGELKVELFDETDLGECTEIPQDDRVLSVGDQFNVVPGDWHRFVALSDCRVLEVYWTVDIDSNDIHRADEGGILVT